MDMDEAFELSHKIKNRVYQSEDSAEGPRAFAEKRPAVWKNR
jgi:enoyl-CoA hydratase/carnithine racemase